MKQTNEPANSQKFRVQRNNNSHTNNMKWNILLFAWNNGHGGSIIVALKTLNTGTLPPVFLLLGGAPFLFKHNAWIHQVQRTPVSAVGALCLHFLLASPCATCHSYLFLIFFVAVFGFCCGTGSLWKTKRTGSVETAVTAVPHIMHIQPLYMSWATRQGKACRTRTSREIALRWIQANHCSEDLGIASQYTYRFLDYSKIQITYSSFWCKPTSKTSIVNNQANHQIFWS